MNLLTFPAGWILFRHPIAAGVLAAAALVSSGQAAEAEAKTHTLFMGVDISVQDQKEVRPVEDVRDGAFIVHVNGKEIKIGGHWSAVGMKVQPAMKISTEPVAVQNLVFERAYTSASDPAKKFARQQGEAVAVEQEIDQTINMLYLQSLWGRGGGGGAGPPGTAPPPPSGGSSSLDQHLSNLSSKIHSVETHQVSQVGTMQSELAQELYDAVKVDFELTALEPARNPYVVMTMRFHAADAPPDHSQNWLYAAELEHLDQKPARVHLLKGGFPPGYVLESYQIHVFDGVREIATNVSQERVDLTPSEAYTILRAEYLAEHKAGNHEAVAVMGQLSAADRQRIGADLFRQTFYVKVTKDGSPGTAFADRALTQPAFDAISALVSHARFLPALAAGKPVDGVAELKFSQLHL